MAFLSPATLLAADARAAGPSPLSRLRGAVLMTLGPVLATGMGWALATVGPELLSPSGASGDVRWTGSPDQGIAALLLLAWVALLGVVFTLAGWQLWHHGRMGRRVGVPAALLVAGLLAALPWLRRLFA